ncbi:MAG: methylmalonyl Co-A mutase-associated GTPase MeaB, partial [Bacteroidetes bacterium]|nr:methylmalonyl Co-A mutase-associated GTPase MeaB [Bacteroidota bacterium]
VNKGDRPGADEFVKKLLQIVGSDKINENPITVLKTTAVREEGIKELLEEISTHKPSTISIEKKAYLMAEKAFILIQKARTTDIDKDDLLVNIQDEMEQKDFNLYRFIKQRYNS